MIEQLEELTISVRYKDIVLAGQRAYYQKNVEKTREYSRYQNMRKEQKDKQIEARKRWLEKQTSEKKKEELRGYAKNRYHNHVVYVKS